MWSFACTAFELATGEVMFAPKTGQSFSEDEDHLALMMEILGKIPRKYKFSANDARELADFLIPILDFAPEKRPTAHQCLRHQWLNKSSESGVQKLDSEMSKLQIK
ncbi:hypothetical protein L1987_65522 [Smallanthus sonchifolius]|uniref:Uncharacterized protein n=1 Tax=Smallanthus sonchifolius TaxID=185202 RepID=A0ACB9BUR8_9ASTR|nr:hypothetical protein L1987_65522 [Smallanthus sonchifolius]